MTETPFDGTERATTFISLGWMSFGGPERDETSEWLVEKNQPHDGGWVCS